MTVRLSLAVLLACFTSVPATTAADAPPSRWKLRPGETIRYELTEHVIYSLVPDQPPMEMIFRFELSLDVRKVAEDGSILAALTLDRFRISPGGGAGMPVRPRDTDKREDRTPAQLAVIGRELTFRLSPRGEVADVALAPVRLPPEAEKELADADRDALGAGLLPTMASLFMSPEQSLATFLAAIAFPLPEGPLNAATPPWEHERTDFNAVFELASDMLKYQAAPPGADEGAGPGEQSVRFAGVVRTKPGAAAAKLVKGTVAGVVRFDPTAGRVTGARWERVLTFARDPKLEKPPVEFKTRNELRPLPSAKGL